MISCHCHISQPINSSGYLSSLVSEFKQPMKSATYFWDLTSRSHESDATTSWHRPCLMDCARSCPASGGAAIWASLPTNCAIAATKLVTLIIGSANVWSAPWMGSHKLLSPICTSVSWRSASFDTKLEMAALNCDTCNARPFLSSKLSD